MASKHYAIWHHTTGMLAGNVHDGIYETVIGTEDDALSRTQYLRDNGIDVRRVIELETGRRVYWAVPV